MQQIFNFLLAVIKWPVALLMIALILPAIKTDLIILSDGLTLSVLGWVCLPIVAMILLWLLIPGIGGSFLSILEHESTHMIFALLTAHKPQSITIQRGIGGNFSYWGRGNWLISIAPYFFPTSAFLVILAGVFYTAMDQAPPAVYWLIFGAMTGFHLISTLDEIHIGQPDFQAAGFLFTLFFLPGANLLIYGLLFAYACYGFAGWPMYFGILCDQTRLLFALF